MSTTKTTKTTVGATLAEQEAAALPGIEAERVEAAKLAAAAAETSGEAERLDEHAEDVLSSLRSGDRTHSAAALVQARAEHERMVLLAGADRAAAERAARAVPSTDKSLALAVADVLAPAFHGVPCEGTWLSAPVPPAIPYAVVTSGTSEQDRAGLLGGTVEVKLYRHPLHRELHASELVRALTNARAGADAPGSVQRVTGKDGVVIETLRLRVGGIIPAVPVVKSEPSEKTLERLAFNLALGLADRFPDEHGVKMDERKQFTSRYVATAGKGGQAVSTTTDSNGVRTTVVDVVVWAKPTAARAFDGAITDSDLRGALELLAADMVGDLAPGVGKVVEATLVGPPATQGSASQIDRRMAVRLTCLSRTASAVGVEAA